MTNHERKEGQPSKQEREGQKGKAPTTFLEILRRLQELARNIALSVQEEAERKTLSGRKDELIAEFRGTNFGQKTEAKRQEIGGTLEGILNELEGAKGATDEEFKEKRQAVDKVREKASEEAQKHWEREEQVGVKREHKGIAKHLLGEVTGRAEERQREIIQERGRQDRQKIGRQSRESTSSSRGEKEAIAILDRYLDEKRITKKQYEEAMEAIREGRNAELKNVSGIEGNDIEIDPLMLARASARKFYSIMVTEDMKDKKNRKMRDKEFNKIFKSADRRPDAPFEQSFNMYSDALKLDEFFDIVEEIKDIGQEELQRYIALAQLHRLFHNANFFVSMRNRDIEGFVGYMNQFDSKLGDYLFKEEWVPGLTEVAYHLLEQALEKMKSDNEGTMPPEKFTVRVGQKRSDWDERAREWLESYLKMGLLRDGNGEVVRSLDDWEIDNALRMAKGWGIVTKRFLEIVASARKPTELPNKGKFRRKGLEEADLGLVKGRRSVSYWGEGILRVLNPQEHLIGSFNIGDEVMAMLLYKITGRPHPIWNWDELKRNMEAYAAGKLTRGALLETVNLFEIGGAFTSTWRTDMVSALVEGKAGKHAGYGIRLLLAPVEARLEFIRQYRREPKTEKEEKELKDLTMKKKIAIWDEIAANNPLKIIWVLEDEWMRRERTGMTPKERLLRGALIEAGYKIEDDNRVTKEGQDPKTLEKKRDEIERNLILAQEARVQARGEHNLDYYLDKIEDGEQGKAVSEYVKAIRNEFNNYNYYEDKEGKKDKKGNVLKSAAAFAAKELPYNVGTEDAAFRDFEFSSAGAQGLIARRFSDFGKAWEASAALGSLLEHLPDYREPSDIIKQLIAIKEGVDAYNPESGERVVRKLAEGIIRFYDKEWWSKFPIVGSVLSSLLGRAWKEPSYAQHLFGMGAMSLDESDKNNFINHLRLNGLINKEQAKELKGRVGAEFPFVAYDFLRMAIPLAILLFIYSSLKLLGSEMGEEVKKT